MQILVIDGQGGGIGKSIIEVIKKECTGIEIIAVGTNTTATATMMKAGADMYATGENAVVVSARRADIILGPIGILAADSLLGEITPKMAIAVSRSPARKILIPINKCNYFVAGVRYENMEGLIVSAVDILKTLLEGR